MMDLRSCEGPFTPIAEEMATGGLVGFRTVTCSTITNMQTQKHFDVAIVGAGVFGVWTAYQLCQAGANVAIIDAYGSGNSRSSSGGESRIIRMGYGPDEIYSRSAIRSLKLWKELFQRTDTTDLFIKTGVLWLARETDPYCDAIAEILPRLGVSNRRLEYDELKLQYPQLEFTEGTWGLLEPDSGALMARRAVQAVAKQAQRDGTTFLVESVVSPVQQSKLQSIETVSGLQVFADKFVFACGPWLPKLFPELLKDRIYVTRQEVFFFGTPSGNVSFLPERMPIWVDFNDLVYAFPDLENRGFKLAIDAHGPEFDPDTGDRVVNKSGIAAAQEYLRRRVPSLANASVVESRVCQYENTSNGDFLIDRHPDIENAWFVGGGSGHGFKHGPAVGQYVEALISGTGEVEQRFELATKRRFQQRQVF
jgi:sarcosine oxidase